MSEKMTNIWRIVWIIGVYAILVLLLYLTVVYKVKWEDRDLNKYLYFYKCSHELCTTDTEITGSYSSVVCKNNECPMIIEKNNNYVILKTSNDVYVYDYIDGKEINHEYKNYQFLDNNYLIVTNKNNLQGIIDYDGEVVVDFNYTEISSFKNDFIVFKNESKYGLDNDKKNIHIPAKYKDIAIIDDQIFAYKDEDNGYYIVSYKDLTPISNTIYDYIVTFDELIFTIKDKQIDIMDAKLKSKLLMKIDTYYSYKTPKEINNLDLYIKDNQLYFTVNMGNNKYVYYIYDIKNNKIYTK